MANIQEPGRMSIKIALTVSVDTQGWIDAFGVDLEDVRADFLEYFQTMIQESSSLEQLYKLTGISK